MPIDGSTDLDRNSLDYGLPLDTCCVGGGGPAPMEAAMISKSGPKASAPPNPLRIKGGTTMGWGGPSGKSPAQSSDVRGAHNTGYDGP